MTKRDKIIITGEFDLDALRSSIENIKEFDQAEDFFHQLTEVVRVKAEIAALQDQLKTVEDEAKGLINAKATALFGHEWKAVKGHGFKITRSGTGAVFDIAGKPQKKFLIIKETVDANAVKEYIVGHDGKLPDGIDYNPNRGESIRITVEK